MAEYLIQDTTLTAIADGFRSSRGTTKKYSLDEMAILAAEPVDDGSGGGSAGGGGGGGGVSPKAVNFYDYDGTVLHAYTKEEFLALTEMPPLPEREGLICQEWNWSFEDMQDYTSKHGVCNAGATYTTDDGTTRIYITLHEGRTSPMLGVCPNGTVTVDWGDGTTPDVLTGTSTSTVVYTPNHNYAAPGDYIIKLTVDGAVALQYSSSGSCLLAAVSTVSDKVNYAYRGVIKKIEFGTGIAELGGNSLYDCAGITTVVIPNGVTTFNAAVFYNCYSLSSVIIPNSVTKIFGDIFYNCYSLSSAAIPNGVTTFSGSVFRGCRSLSSVTIPDGVTTFGSYTFYGCNSLSSVAIPDGVTQISGDAFENCNSLSSVIIPNSVTKIVSKAFAYCYGLAFLDFTSCTAVPTLSNTNAFSSIPTDCEIRVPAALYDNWIAATNWSTYASQIVAV